MHEYSLMENVIEAITDNLKDKPVTKVKKLSIQTKYDAEFILKIVDQDPG